MSAIGTTILVLTFCMSFAIYLGTGQGTIFTQMVGLSAVSGSLYTGFMLLLTVTVGATVVVGIFSQLNPYALFSGIGILVLGFFTLPIDLLASTTLPLSIKAFIGGLFGMMYILATLGWFKGQNEP